MIRLLFWVLIGWVAIAAIRKLAAGAGGARGAAASAPEDMVRCLTCRLNVPKSEAIAVAGGWACCPEHAQPPAARP